MRKGVCDWTNWWVLRGVASSLESSETRDDSESPPPLVRSRNSIDWEFRYSRVRGALGMG
jgi:hypothetical protein